MANLQRINIQLHPKDIKALDTISQELSVDRATLIRLLLRLNILTIKRNGLEQVERIFNAGFKNQTSD